jgi:hypothetical protein
VKRAAKRPGKVERKWSAPFAVNDRQVLQSEQAGLTKGARGGKAPGSDTRASQPDPERTTNVGNEQMKLLLSRQLGSLSAPQPLTAELEPRWSPPAGLALLAGKGISGLPTGCGAP